DAGEGAGADVEGDDGAHRVQLLGIGAGGGRWDDGADQPMRPEYQSIISGPQNRATSAPAARKGPKGTAIFRARDPTRISSAIPRADPARNASASAGITEAPSTAPMRSASLTSPRPI